MKNQKVPVALLSCFLIAFVLQVLLKLCGVFVFEKALTWDIFRIIDSSKALSIIYYSLLNLIAVYCLSFALTSRSYSKKWYHYLLIFIGSFGITTFKFLLKTPVQIEFLYDTISYIIIPVVINVTTSKEHRLFKLDNLTNVIMTITIQILLYFTYLGFCYWSSLLNSLILVTQVVVYASTTLLITLEAYTGLITLMLSLNILIKLIKKEDLI